MTEPDRQLWKGWAWSTGDSISGGLPRRPLDGPVTLADGGSYSAAPCFDRLAAQPGAGRSTAFKADQPEQPQWRQQPSMPDSDGKPSRRSRRQDRHPATGGAENAWTSIELRAIALGEAAADSLGMIPQHLTGGDRTAWRAGFGRGWAGLTKGARVDVPKLAPFQDAWREGHRKGMEVCKAAADGYKIEWDPRALTVVQRGRAAWSQEQADAYDDGYRVGSEGFNSAKMPLRYRGPLQSHITMWLWGQTHGRKGYEPDGSGRPRQAKATEVAEAVGNQPNGRRHPVTPGGPVPPNAQANPLPVAEDIRDRHEDGRHPVTQRSRSEPPREQTPPINGVARHRPDEDCHRVTVPARSASTPDRKAESGVERQRAYRARRRSRSIDISEETHALLRQLRDLRGVRLDEALRIALRAALDGAGDQLPAPDRARTDSGRPESRSQRAGQSPKAATISSHR